MSNKNDKLEREIAASLDKIEDAVKGKETATGLMFQGQRDLSIEFGNPFHIRQLRGGKTIFEKSLCFDHEVSKHALVGDDEGAERLGVGFQIPGIGEHLGLTLLIVAAQFRDAVFDIAPAPG